MQTICGHFWKSKVDAISVTLHPLWQAILEKLAILLKLVTFVKLVIPVNILILVILVKVAILVLLASDSGEFGDFANSGVIGETDNSGE